MNKKDKFSIHTHWISSLGETKSNTFLPFNLIVLSYSIFNIYFLNKTQWLFNSQLQSILSYIFFSVYSLFVILILFFPQDKNLNIHRGLSDLLFLSVMFGLVLSFLSTLDNTGTHVFLKAMLIITIFTGVLLGYSAVKMYLKWGKIPRNLVEVRKKEMSLFIRSSCLLEWTFFFLLICYQIYIVIT